MMARLVKVAHNCSRWRMEMEAMERWSTDGLSNLGFLYAAFYRNWFSKPAKRRNHQVILRRPRVLAVCWSPAHGTIPWSPWSNSKNSKAFKTARALCLWGSRTGRVRCFMPVFFLGFAASFEVIVSQLGGRIRSYHMCPLKWQEQQFRSGSKHCSTPE